ncbi:hypothetical protein [Phycicoccus sp. SLBN-51]|uniref:hypothetical protein n=1 Tax=Phycicoccus sp. SLBN-51 TaxID=2768447 RepID=UPI001152E43C|nr:hypothetical protein [Phycicoccus sp. SLBN-51]TQJ49071.1 hypothetical protein FBY26_0740 [Phycicoccus sp. SLBN-51]
MRRVLILITSCLLFLFAGSATAQAASPHFKKGGEPVCTISYSNLYTSSTTCKAVLAGLGNDDLLATVTVNGFAKYQCQNQGGNTAPGQNKVLEGPATEPTFIDSSAIKNGNLTLNTNAVTLAADPTATAAEAGCPNNNWTGVNPVLTVTSIRLVIEQPVGTTIFDCSASDPNGLTSPVTLTC